MAEGGVKDKAREKVSGAKRRLGMERPIAAEEGGRVGIVRGALQSFGSGDMDGFLDALKDDAPFECPSGRNFPGAGDHTGADEVKETFVADAGRTYASFGFEPEMFVEAEDADAVIVFGSFVGEAVEGGDVDTRAVQIWEFKGNTVEAVRIYADSADFPEVVSEEQLREQEEEDRKREEGESESDEGGDTEAKSGDDTEAKSGDDTEAKSGDDTEAKSGDDTEGRSDDDTGDSDEDAQSDDAEKEEARSG